MGYRAGRGSRGVRGPWHERRIRLRAALRRLAARLAAKGRERLTFMLVPHSQRRILSLHIANWVIACCVLAVVATVALSMVFLNAHEARRTEIANLAGTIRDGDHILELSRIAAEYTWRAGERLGAEARHLIGLVGVPDGDDGLAPGPRPFAARPWPPLPAEPAARGAELARRLAWAAESCAETAELLGRAGRLVEALRALAGPLPSIWPIPSGGVLIGPFGKRKSPFDKHADETHPGVDIVWFAGAPVVAAADGVVNAACDMTGYGNCVFLDHPYGIQTRYAHLMSVSVAAGERVKRGQVIGRLGSTGMSVGFHLHYEVRINDAAVDPVPFLRGWLR